MTDLYTTRSGIKQCDSLSPILFNTFIDSVVDILCPLECAAVTLDDILLNCLIYADDVLLISSTALGLQNSMNRLNSYCNKWALEINLEKTKVMVFKNNKKEEAMQFNIAGKPVDVVKSFNYLGSILTENGKFTMASNDLKTKGMRALFKINSILKSQKINDHIIKLKLFDSMVKPILLYGCQVWSQELIHIESKDISKLDVIPSEQVHNKQC